MLITIISINTITINYNINFLQRYMGAPTGIDVEALRVENEQLKLDKQALEAQIKELNTKSGNQQVVIEKIKNKTNKYIYSIDTYQIRIKYYSNFTKTNNM